jgi:signal transduction histidine kinase/DNA-binding NarL/FixJ family response regulator
MAALRFSPRRRTRVLLLALAALGARPVDLPAADEHGRSLTRNFGPRDFSAPAEIHDIVQAPDGRLFFASQQTLLEYDGATWARHSGTSVLLQALATDDRGRLFVGSNDDVGVFEPDASGELVYHSLIDQVPAELKPIGPSHGVVVRPDGVYFALERHVLRWRDGHFTTWSFAPGKTHRLIPTGGELFLHRPGDALYRFTGGKFEPFVRTPEIRDAARLAVWKLDDGAWLIGAGRAGLWTCRKGRVDAWPNAAGEILRHTEIACGVTLADRRIAIGTVGAGVVIVSPDGRQVQQLAAPHGLPDPAVFHLFLDRDRGLWVGTNSGVSRVDPNDGFTLFDAANGLRQPIINGIWRHAGRLYVSTLDGLLRLVPGDSSTGQAAHFESVPPIGRNPREMASDPRGLLIGTREGLVRLDEHDRATLVLATGELVLHPVWSRHSPGSLLLGCHDSLIVARPDGDRWVQVARFGGLGEVRTIAESDDGTVWLGTPTRGFHRIARPAGDEDWTHATVTTYNQGNGRLYPDHGWVEVFPSPIGPIFSTDLKWLRYHPATDDFVPDDRFLIAGRHIESVRPVEATPNGDLWVQATSMPAGTEFPLGRFRPRPDGSFAWESAPHVLWDVIGLSGAQVIYWEPDGAEGILWVKGIDSLLRLEVAKLAPRRAQWQVLLKNFQQRGEPRPVADGAILPRLPWSAEPIRITYASPRFDPGAGVRYRTRLLGFSDQWSDDSAREEATFTNLSGGPFTFEVQARDAEGNVSIPARLTFSVSPPWPRSPAAYAIYILAGIGAVFGFVRWRLARAERERLRLERIVAERTAELKIAKDSADEANRAKSAFLANISHELRTPLNGVIGYAQILMKDRELTARNRERLRIVQTSGEHLLRMINEVLDFSKIEAGKMELATTPFHLPQLLRDIAAAASPRFEQKQLEFVFDPAPDLPDLVIGDPLKLRQVIDNLLGNAAKFTTNGKVTFAVRHPAGRSKFICDPSNKSDSPPDPVANKFAPTDGEMFEFSVTDTGVGISDADLARLFTPFQQAVDGRPPEPGTGLGLAISQRLVGLMDGKLEVESRSGTGSRFFFVVRLPVLATDAAARRSTASLITGYHGRRRRILIVDDIATNRHVLRELLEPLGFEIAEAAGGAEALVAAPQFDPDVIFLDLRMPGIDGLELARRLRERAGGDRMKLIAMSASVLAFNREKAMEAGCDDFLPKPFREDDLLARLGLALQLEWIGSSERAAGADSRPPFAGFATHLASGTLAELLAIARRGEVAQLRRRLADLAGDPLADALDAIAKTYRMELIRELLEQHLAKAPSAS